jgi:hypothetical protein
VLFRVTYHLWTNRAKADTQPEGKKRRETETARDRIRSTMKLIESDAYKTLVTRTNEMKMWVLTRCMPSYLLNGIYFVKLIAVEEVETKIAEFNTWIATEGVPALIDDWDRAKAQAQIDFAKAARELGIENPYNEDRYPDTKDLYAKFGVEHAWVTFGVPENLPEEIRERESVKIRASYDNAAEEISAALREGFSAIVAHAVDQMSSGPGEKKIIKESLVVNFKEFCETFKFRNLTDDGELESLVKQAEAIMSGVDARRLRESPRTRREVVNKLAEVKATIDKMIVTAPRRKIDLDELDE